MAEMMITYVLLFLLISVLSFHFGREWEKIEQEEIEEQKRRDPIRRVPGRWE